MAETTSQITPNAAFLKLLTNLLVSLLFIAGLVFAGAGRLDWGLGWLFVAVWGLLKFAHILYLRWHDPALMVERGTSHENTQQYDRRIVRVYSVISFSTFLIAGLDGGRFHWSGPVPPVLILLAYVVYLIGNWISGWAASSNPFFSTEFAPAGGSKPKSGPQRTLSFRSPSRLFGPDFTVVRDRNPVGIVVGGYPRAAFRADDLDPYVLRRSNAARRTPWLCAVRSTGALPAAARHLVNFWKSWFQRHGYARSLLVGATDCLDADRRDHAAIPD